VAKRKPLDPGERAVRFINALTHTSGKFAKQPFNLRPWQKAIIRSLFGTIRPDGLRQFRTALLMLPRKNGKSELAAAIALYGLLGDGEVGAQVYSAAADKEQASLVFNAAATMVRNDPELSAICEIIDSQKRIVHRASGSFYRAISAEAYSKHGFNASLVIYDELHAAPNGELWDVLSSSMGARLQPLMLAISTAGYNRQSKLWKLYDYACKVRDGLVDDPTFLPVIYEAPVNADWKDEAVWHAANPALGDFRFMDDLRASLTQAKEMRSEENKFRNLFLNQWTEQAERWIPMELWEACRDPQFSREALRGRRCYIGVDLSATQDLTAVVAVIRDGDGFAVLPFFFCPRDTMAIRSRRDRVDYVQWASDGYMNPTNGDSVDYEAPRALINALAREFDVRHIAVDPWNARDFITRLKEVDGFGEAVSEMRQGYADLNSPSKSLEIAIAKRALKHDGHPVMTWTVSNVAIERDPSQHIKPSKKASTERIDGVAALVMAIDRMERDHEPASVYETAGVLVI
jgi:phage terminase large subunit-like protein